MKLFEDFEIIRFKEIEKDDLTGLGKMKHWHIFDVIAKKIQNREIYESSNNKATMGNIDYAEK